MQYPAHTVKPSEYRGIIYKWLSSKVSTKNDGVVVRKTFLKSNKGDASRPQHPGRNEANLNAISYLLLHCRLVFFITLLTTRPRHPASPKRTNVAQLAPFFLK